VSASFTVPRKRGLVKYATARQRCLEDQAEGKSGVEKCLTDHLERASFDTPPLFASSN
jgi:hypothetical protein